MVGRGMSETRRDLQPPTHGILRLEKCLRQPRGGKTGWAAEGGEAKVVMWGGRSATHQPVGTPTPETRISRDLAGPTATSQTLLQKQNNSQISTPILRIQPQFSELTHNSQNSNTILRIQAQFSEFTHNSQNSNTILRIQPQFSEFKHTSENRNRILRIPYKL